MGLEFIVDTECSKCGSPELIFHPRTKEYSCPQCESKQDGEGPATAPEGCPDCGASGENPCRTPSGKIYRRGHAARRNA